jgi:hypothetical protein
VFEKKKIEAKASSQLALAKRVSTDAEAMPMSKRTFSVHFSELSLLAPAWCNTCGGNLRVVASANSFEGG